MSDAHYAYSPTFEDFLAAEKLGHRKSALRYYGVIAGMFALGVLLVELWRGKEIFSQHWLYETAETLAYALIGTVLFDLFYFRRTARRRWSDKNSRPIGFNVRREGLVLNYRDGPDMLRWSELSSWSETDDLIALLISSGLLGESVFMVLNKRDVGEAEATRLRSMLRVNDVRGD